jgi:hypothetical protein
MPLHLALRRWWLALGLLLVFGGIATLHPLRAAASTQHVTSCADNGTGSLRDTLATAGASDILVFDQDCTGGSKITLATTLTLSQAVTIDGTGQTVTVSGGGAVRVFQVSSGVTANIVNLTITNGSVTGSGGGIANQGTLALTDSTISGNTVSGFGSNGGGIQNANGATLTMTRCTLSGNTGGNGGGINNSGGATVTNSTIANNTSTSFGGGGGIFNSVGATLTTVNSTFSGNAASVLGGGGGIFNSGTFTATNTLIAGNTAGGTGPDLNGTVVSNGNNLIGNTTGNLGWTASDLQNAAPRLAAFGSYGGPTQTFALLPGSPAIDAGTSTGAPATDQRGSPRAGAVDIGSFESQGFTVAIASGNNQRKPFNTAFSPLVVTVTGANSEPVNGGIVTFTGPPSGAGIQGSPLTGAIASGQASVTPSANGTIGGPYTVTATTTGASAPALFSLTNTDPPNTTLTVGTTVDHAPTSPAPFTECTTVSNTTCALRDALGYAISGTDTIVFKSGIGPTITLANGTLALTDSVTITGPGAATLAVDGNGSVQVVAVNSGVTATIGGLTIQNGNAPTGGGLDNRGTLTLTNSIISGNAASTGSGIRNAGMLTLTNSTISGNTASVRAGGVNNGGTLMLVNSTVTGNTASAGGGGIDNAGTLTLVNSTIRGNNGGVSGGGIENSGVMATLMNTIVAGNSGSSGPDIAGNVTSGGHNLIGIIDGSSGFPGTGDLTGTGVAPLNPLLASIGVYGSANGTQTFALLPGSPAIAAGATGGGIPTTDQRGIARTGHTDIGAFQSQGFSLSLAGGDNQARPTGAAFATPLAVTVASTHSEPVQNGLVTFTPPASNASATLTTSPASIAANGGASVTATANATVGAYMVTASAAGASPNISFSLANIPALTGISPASGSTAGGGIVTLTGQGFGTTTNTDVLINGVAIPAANITSVTATTITFTAPPHAAGAATVAARVSGATSPSLTYQYGTVATTPATKPPGMTSGSPNPLPPVQPQPAGPASGSPRPLPGPRP